MSAAYWAQWSYSEILSIHGIELNKCHDNDEDYDCDAKKHVCDDDGCPRCSGRGCNFCLMCSY